MRRSGICKKGLVIGIIMLFIGINMQYSTQGFSTLQSNKTYTTNSLNHSFFDNTTHYYAVICACSRYENPRYDLPKGSPAPVSKLRVLYDALLQTKNWDKENIILLLNQNATKQNITNALEIMSILVGPNDIFLFTWNGHGGEVPDLSGDEAKWDHNDTHNEVICPYDTNRINGNLTNVITDDELGYYFSNIHGKGKCLIFESCLSGGLVDKKPSNSEGIQNYCRVGEPTIFETDFLRDITHPGTLDGNGNNTIVIMSTLPDTLGLATHLTFSPLLYSVAETITDGKKYDKNNDGFLSAEEIFRIARPLTLIQSSFRWIFIYIYDWSFVCLYYKFILYPLLSSLPPLIKKIYDRLLPKPLVLVTFDFPISYLFAQIFLKYITGHYALNWPNTQDDYPGELPLVQL
jgi:hypothetical protein